MGPTIAEIPLAIIKIIKGDPFEPATSVTAGVQIARKDPLYSTRRECLVLDDRNLLHTHQRPEDDCERKNSSQGIRISPQSKDNDT